MYRGMRMKMLAPNFGDPPSKFKAKKLASGFAISQLYREHLHMHQDVVKMEAHRSTLVHKEQK